MAPNGAKFGDQEVKVYVAGDQTCSMIDVADKTLTSDQIASFTQQAIHDFWNTVPTSSLRLRFMGFWKKNKTEFIGGKLCNFEEDNVDDCTKDHALPKVTSIVISCNSLLENFTSSTFAKTMIYLQDSAIEGAHVILNNTPSTPLNRLNAQQMVWVVAHEMGHAIGLGHTNDAANLMYFTLTPQRNKLGEDDIWGLTYLYPQQIDGCGVMASTKMSRPNNMQSLKNLKFNTSILLSFFSGIFFLSWIVVLQKLFFKRHKTIF